MANAAFSSWCFLVGQVASVPTERGRHALVAAYALSRQSLPTDPIGTYTLTLTNLAVGSAIQVESQTGVALYNGTAASATVVVPLQAYAPGSPLNDLRIKVRKGSASPFYQPWQTQATAVKGAASIFVSQIPDE
jgi:hypothetical protein